MYYECSTKPGVDNLHHILQPVLIIGMSIVSQRLYSGPPSLVERSLCHFRPNPTMSLFNLM